MPLGATLTVLLTAVSVSPASVPAQGRQEAIVTVDKPSMVHFHERAQRPAVRNRRPSPWAF